MTGVQTCALPIYCTPTASPLRFCTCASKPNSYGSRDQLRWDPSSATGASAGGAVGTRIESIWERSVAGANRVAEAGAWLGGIVPYGYRKVGEKRDAHLNISEEPIPGLALSEAEVIREVFRMAAVERKSCWAIAARLNNLRIPCAYTRDDRLTLRGKRKQRTSGIWRPARVRWLIMNRTYMGVHEFGKRSTSGRPVISRQVPAIITEELWVKAQANLKAHFVFGKRGWA